jgi:hypothetical protein
VDRYATMYFESLVRIVTGPSDGFLEALAEAVADCRDRAPFPFHPWLQATLGHCLLVAGRTEAAASALETAFEAAEQANMPHFMTYTSAMLAVALAKTEDAGARDDLVDALRSARASQDPWIEIEVLTALATIEADTEAGPEYLRDALSTARSVGFGHIAARLEALVEIHPSGAAAE